MNKPNYVYKAKLRSVYDGDTMRVDLDLGCGVWLKNEPIRLFGINAPEIRGKEKVKGIKARDALRGLLEGHSITVKTIKDKKGKYGRYLGIVFVEGVNVNEWLVKQGFAVKKDY